MIKAFLKKPKHYYLLASVVLWVAIGSLLLGWAHGQKTISFVAASNGVTHIILLSGTLVAAALYYLFTKKYFVPKHAPIWVIRGSYLSIFCMSIGAVFPASAGLPLQIHRLAANGLVISLCVMLAAYIFNYRFKLDLRIHATLALLAMVGSVVIVKKIAGQAISLGIFNIFILSTIYHKHVNFLESTE